MGSESFDIEEPTASAYLWRYMDFPKYVAILMSSGFWLPRSDGFNDAFEGSYPKANEALRQLKWATVRKQLDDAGYKDDWGGYTKFFMKMREWTYISCWHENESESAAMWNLYAHYNEAIAIQTTYLPWKNEMLGALPGVLTGRVKYIDYAKETFPDELGELAYFHKRRSFSHESEIRAVYEDPAIPVGADDRLDMTNNNASSGVLARVDLKKVINEVRIAPTAPKWFADVVSETTRRFGFSLKVQQSDLDEIPYF